MKRLIILCLTSVVIFSICQNNEEIWTSDIDEVVTSHARRCSKNCHCPESCRCRITGCRGCCDKYKNSSNNINGCVTAFCDCASKKCSCGCTNDENSCYS